MKILLNIIFWTLVLYVLIISLVYLFQDKIIFQPKKLPKDYSFQFDNPYEEIWLKTSDQEQINALHFVVEAPKGVVLYLHGNKGNLQRWANYYEDFLGRGYDFLAIDYRGFGKSSGKPSEAGLYEDARTAYDWLLKKYDAAQIIIYGRSLGTGVASQLATEVDARLLILETPYNTIQGAFVHSFPILWYPFPFKSVFSNEANLQAVEEPVFIFQGTNDYVVPYASASLLKPYLKTEDAFFTIEGGGHKNLNSFPLYYQYLDQIIR